MFATKALLKYVITPHALAEDRAKHRVLKYGTGRTV